MKQFSYKNVTEYNINLKNIDQGGSLNMGFRDQFVLPEINADNS